MIPDITNCITDGHFDPRKVVRPLKVIASFPLVEAKTPVKAIPVAVRKVVKLYTE